MTKYYSFTLKWESNEADNNHVTLRTQVAEFKVATIQCYAIVPC